MRNYLFIGIVFFANNLIAAEAEQMALDQPQCQYVDVPDDIKVVIATYVIMQYKPLQDKDLWHTIMTLIGKKKELSYGSVKLLYGALAKNPAAVGDDIYKLDALMRSIPCPFSAAMLAFRRTSLIYPEYFDIVAQDPRGPFMGGPTLSTIKGSFLFRALASSFPRKAGHELWKYIQQHPEIIGYDTKNLQDYIKKQSAIFEGYQKQEKIDIWSSIVAEKHPEAVREIEKEADAFNARYARQRAVVALLNNDTITDQDLQGIVELAEENSTFLMSLFRDKRPILYRIVVCCKKPGINFDRLLKAGIDYASQDIIDGDTILFAVIKAGNNIALRKMLAIAGEMVLDAQHPKTLRTPLVEALEQAVYHRWVHTYQAHFVDCANALVEKGVDVSMSGKDRARHEELLKRYCSAALSQRPQVVIAQEKPREKVAGKAFACVQVKEPERGCVLL